MKEALEEMWAALAAYQPQAEKAGHGKSWERMCREKTSAAAFAASYATNADAYAYAVAAYAAYAASVAAAFAEAENGYAVEWAQKAINTINLLIKPVQPKEPEPEPVTHKHEWFRTGGMKVGQMRCISCGTWGQEEMPQRTWARLMRGVRAEGDTVVITVKGGDDAARELCVELLKEKNT